MLTTPKYPVESTYSPCLIRGTDNKQLYAVGGGQWLPVPEGTTIDNVHLYMRKKEYVTEAPLKKYEVKSKGKTYKVEVWKNKSITCECSGFRYRKTCKHAVGVQKVVNKIAS